MRMRRKPWARPELEACDFFVYKPKENKGNLKNTFNNIFRIRMWKRNIYGCTWF